jgi:hypothetical protein
MKRKVKQWRKREVYLWQLEVLQKQIEREAKKSKPDRAKLLGTALALKLLRQGIIS